MGCVGSSNSNTEGQMEVSSKLSEDPVQEDEKWKNYGGVYVGLPADPSTVPQIQIGPLRDPWKRTEVTEEL